MIDLRNIHAPDADCNYAYAVTYKGVTAMKTNKLPKGTPFKVTFLTETSAGIAGTTLTVQHDERGWHGIDGHGEVYELFAEHLKDPELCRVEELI